MGPIGPIGPVAAGAVALLPTRVLLLRSLSVLTRSRPERGNPPRLSASRKNCACSSSPRNELHHESTASSLACCDSRKRRYASDASPKSGGTVPAALGEMMWTPLGGSMVGDRSHAGVGLSATRP